MANKLTNGLTPVETVIMDCLWQLGAGTVKQVQEMLEPVRPLAYNSVLTMMRILRDKGFLQSRRSGRSDIYRPLVTREQVGRRSLNDVTQKFFEGSARLVVSQLLARKGITREEIEAIRREVNASLAAEKAGDGEEQ